jgi:single-strand DNA-binding protein
MNVVHLQGRLTNDPELIEIKREDGQITHKVAFGLAINERYKKETGEVIDYATFIDCVAWDSGAKLIDKFFRKGKAILVHGKLIVEEYTKDEINHKRVKVRVTNFEFPLTEKSNDTNPK